MSELAWQPSEDFLSKSNVARFMAKAGFRTHASMEASWRDDPASFWELLAADIGLDWHLPYTSVLDVSRGIEYAEWFGGGRTNLAWLCVDRHPADAPAVIWEGEEGDSRALDYGELRTLVDRLARGLASLGVEAGDRVGLYLPLVPEACAAFYACAKLGAVALPLFSGFAADSVATRLQAAEAKLLICADAFPRRGKVVAMKTTADAAVSASPSVEHLIVVERMGVSVPWTQGRDLRWQDVLSSDESPLEPLWVDSSHPFLIAFTSGTTGPPKGVVHGHACFALKMASEIVYHLDYRREDVLWWLTDVGWIMAPETIVGVGFAGGTIMLYDGVPDHPGPDRVWDTVARRGVTILGLSPTLIRGLMLHGVEPVERHQLGKLRILASSGEPWNDAPWQWYFDVVGGGRCPIINIGGGTESGSLLGALPILGLKPSSFNSPCIGVSVGIRKGELVVLAPWPGKTSGFWRDPDRYIDTYWSTWPGVWRHGDWASKDDDGYWFLHGRADDTLMVAGKRLGPTEVESALVAHPGVRDAAVIGLPHVLTGEGIWCFCVLAPGVEPSEELTEELRAAVVARLGKAYAPAAIRYISDLPRTRSGKVMRRLIRAAALHLDGGDASTLENPGVLAEIKRAGPVESGVEEQRQPGSASRVR